MILSTERLMVPLEKENCGYGLDLPTATFLFLLQKTYSLTKGEISWRWQH